MNRILCTCSLVVFIVVLSGAFIACEHTTNDSDAPAAAGVIMPLAVGNQWVYKTTTLDSLGAIVGSPTFDTLTILSERIIGSDKWVVDNSGVVQMNKSDGRHIYSGGSYLVERFPAALNDMHRLYDSLTTVRVRGVRETMVVLSVPYSTYIYRREARGIVQADYFYAVNTGLVKSEEYASSASGQYVSERRELLWKSLK